MYFNSSCLKVVSAVMMLKQNLLINLSKFILFWRGLATERWYPRVGKVAKIQSFFLSLYKVPTHLK